MPLTVLSDSEVRTLLLSLTKTDILDLQQSLADALHYYSTSTENDSNGCCSSYQPLRTSLKRSDGQTTLFMPASSNDGLGVKIVTLSDPDADIKKLSKSGRTGTGASAGSGSASLASLSSLSISEQSTTNSSTRIPPDSISSAQSTTPKGLLTLLDRTGAPRALINAEEITAFRTALASTMMFKKRHNVHDVVVFGAGKQAYWHIRLALLLRGPEVHHLNIINRSFESAHNLIEKLYRPEAEPAAFPTINVPEADHPLSRPKIQIITPGAQEYERILKATIRSSSIIFCTTPSITPLFPASYLTSPEGRKKGRYVAAIGSYKPHMVEIHPDIIKQNVQADHHHHHHKHAPQGGAIIVDSVEACLKEAGEIIQAGISGKEVVEIGELIMLKKDAEARRLESRNDSGTELDEQGVELGEAKHVKGKKREQKGEDKAEKSLMEWLQKGNVIYKSVGLGLMDVVVGADLVRVADERGIGTRIENF
jgi:ornithine cyclodeaminase/alanine dehydrogenase-like protein (mu-crystallin family)